jgi:hypothetical protein
VLGAKRGGEERTAGSDQKIRYSSGGPISLDPRYIYFFLPYTQKRKAAHMTGGVGGRGGGGGGRGGGGWYKYYTMIEFNMADFTFLKNTR